VVPSAYRTFGLVLINASQNRSRKRDAWGNIKRLIQQ